MKTTIEIPDELFQRSKIAAAERKTTLKELVITGLKQVVDTSPDQEAAAWKTRAEAFLDEFEATNTEPMQPLTRKEIYAGR